MMGNSITACSGLGKLSERLSFLGALTICATYCWGCIPSVRWSSSGNELLKYIQMLFKK